VNDIFSPLTGCVCMGGGGGASNKIFQPLHHSHQVILGSVLVALLHYTGWFIVLLTLI